MHIKLNSYLKYYNLFVHMEDYIKRCWVQSMTNYFYTKRLFKDGEVQLKKSAFVFFCLTIIYHIR